MKERILIVQIKLNNKKQSAKITLCFLFVFEKLLGNYFFPVDFLVVVFLAAGFFAAVFLAVFLAGCGIIL